MSSKALLQIKNLKVAFHSGKMDSIAVDGVNLSINKGETVAVIGESGSGKSVTSLSVLGLLPPNGRIIEGDISFNDTDLLQLPEKKMKKIRGKEISMIFQDAMVSLNPAMRVGKQIISVLKHHKAVPNDDYKNEALRLLSLVGFSEPHVIYHNFPAQLSGGMRQRVLIAMAISCKPQLIIADEPTTALDVTIQKQILDLMHRYQKQTDTSILLITHDFGLVAEYANRVFVMLEGKVVEIGDVFSIFENPIHPYTKGLINSIPRINEKQERLKTVKDFVGNSIHALHDNEVEQLIEIEKGHYVRQIKGTEDV
jgi:peptide/nickel transport system ATP-binding protein